MIPDMSKEAEQYAIGSTLTDPSKIPMLIELPEDCFYLPEHKAIHRAVTELFSRSMPVDLFSLSEQLERTQAALGVDWMGYLSELAENHPSSVHFESYAASLADYAKRRDLAQLAQNLEMQLANGGNTAAIIESLQDGVVGLESSQHRGGIRTWNEVLNRGIDRIEQRQTNPGQLSGQASGYEELDRKLDGFEDGKVYVIGGRTSMGKSAWMLQLVYRLAAANPWVLFSLEMTDESIAQRALSNASNVYSNKLRANPEPMGPGDVSAFAAGIKRAKDYKLFVDHTPGLAVAQIRARLKVHVLRNGPVRGIVIDHIGLVKKPNGMGQTDGMTAVAHELQNLAKEFNCPLIELVQINRGSESEKDKRPAMHQLKQSGAIEEDADVIMLVYRDEYYNADTQHPGTTEINIAKNRDNETGVLAFESNMATGRYKEIGAIQPEPNKKKQGAPDL